MYLKIANVNRTYFDSSEDIKSYQSFQRGQHPQVELLRYDGWKVFIEFGEKLDQTVITLRVPVLDSLVEIVELETDRRYLVIGELGAFVKSKVYERAANKNRH